MAVQLAVGAELVWQDNSLTWVTGGDFRVDPEVRQTLTFEHASSRDFGDLFFFVDGTRFNGGKGTSLYGELSPRWCLPVQPKGHVRAVLLASTLEFGHGDIETLLVGPAVGLALPGLDFFSSMPTRGFPCMVRMAGHSRLRRFGR